MKRFENAYKLCDGDINKFCLMLRKEIYSYKIHGKSRNIQWNMTSWQKWILKGFTDEDFDHANRIWKVFK